MPAGHCRAAQHKINSDRLACLGQVTVIYPINACAANERIIANTTLKNVFPVSTAKDIRANVAGKHISTGTAEDILKPRDTIRSIGTACSTSVERDNDGPRSAFIADPVIASAANKGVITKPAINSIVICTAINTVIASAATQCVIGKVAQHRVIAIAASKRIHTIAAIDAIGASAAKHAVISGIIGEGSTRKGRAAIVQANGYTTHRARSSTMLFAASPKAIKMHRLPATLELCGLKQSPDSFRIPSTSYQRARNRKQNQKIYNYTRFFSRFT